MSIFALSLSINSKSSNGLWAHITIHWWHIQALKKEQLIWDGYKEYENKIIGSSISWSSSPSTPCTSVSSLCSLTSTAAANAFMPSSTLSSCISSSSYIFLSSCSPAASTFALDLMISSRFSAWLTLGVMITPFLSLSYMLSLHILSSQPFKPHQLLFFSWHHFDP